MYEIFPNMVFHVLLPNRVPDNSLDYIDGKKVELLLALSKFENTNKDLKIITRHGRDVICKLKKVTFWDPVFVPVAVNLPLIFELETSKNRLEKFVHDEIDAFVRI